jgi:N-methylhydantoinase B
LGDFHAQLAATLRGKDLLESAIERYGSDLITRVMTETQAYSERVVRSVIRSIPDGDYFGEDECDGFRLEDPTVKVRVRISITGDEAVVDLSQTDDQVSWPCNSPRASTDAAVYTIFGALSGAQAPTNDGSYRPIKIITRPGSFVDPLHPAPVRGRMTAASRVASAMKRALVDVLPERVPAAGNDSTNMVSFSRRGAHGYEMFTETLAGGTGAGWNVDGESVVAQTLSNSSNTPVESIEMDHDFVRVREYRQAVDSAGAGRFRGGLGQRRVYEILEDGVLLSTNGDRHSQPPWGAANGSSGTRSRYSIIRSGQEIQIPAASTERLNKGDLFVVELTGGGGFGDPLERSRDLVALDLADGRISAVAARDLYGYTPNTQKA